MKREKVSFLETMVFIAVVLLFIFFGQSVGWRAAGMVQLVISFVIIRRQRVGCGWAGFEPSFYIKGIPAILIGLLSICIAIMLLFFPEQTIMKLNS